MTRRDLPTVHWKFTKVPAVIRDSPIRSSSQGRVLCVVGHLDPSSRKDRPVHKLSVDVPFTCVTCEAEIRGRPVFHVGLPFCCAGCVAGGPCTCSYEDNSLRAVRHCLDVADPVSPFAPDTRGVVVASKR